MEAVLGGGCFWCIQAALKVLPGVESVLCGYAGGDTTDPSYKEVCTGTTGHAEVVKVVFDEEILPYKKLLEAFFRIHDPTQKNRQGPDIGSQYRSIVLCYDDDQLRLAQTTIDGLQASYQQPIVTQLQLLKKFYLAEEEHQDFFAKNPQNAYCQFHTAPKIKKIKEFLDA